MAVIPDHFDRWTPAADGEVHEVAGATPGGSGNVSTVWRGAKVVNDTPGRVYVRRYGGPLTDAGMADWEVPPWASSVFRLDGSSPGVTLRWEGDQLRGTVDTILLAEDADVVTQTTGLTPERTGAVARVDAFMGAIGGATDTVTDPAVPWIESITVVNPYLYAVEVYKTAPITGQLVGIVPPFSTQTMTLGAPAAGLRIVPFFTSGSYVRGPVNYDVATILHGDPQPPSGPYPFHDFNTGPIGNVVMLGGAAAFTTPVVGVPTTLFTFPAPANTGAYYVVRYMRAMHQVQAGTAPGGTTYQQTNLNLSQGWTGVGGPVLIGALNSSVGPAASMIDRCEWEIHGPLHVYSDPAAANTVTCTPVAITNAAWLAGWQVNFTISGWRVLA